MSFLSAFLLLTAQLFWFYFPTGVANMAPVLVGKRLNFLAKPVDFGRTFRGQPLFGSHKTWRGLIVAILAGGCFFLFQQWLTVRYPALVDWSPWDIRQTPWWFGFLFSAGAILGDLIKSFFKRRVTIAPGKSWFPFDQIDFILGATAVSLFFFPYTWPIWVIILSVGPILHILVNHLGYWFGLKDNAW